MISSYIGSLLICEIGLMGVMDVAGQSADNLQDCVISLDFGNISAARVARILGNRIQRKFRSIGIAFIIHIYLIYLKILYKGEWMFVSFSSIEKAEIDASSLSESMIRKANERSI